MKEPVLIVMAAGMGSRYGGLKQMDPVDEQGHAILDFSVYDAKRAGFKKVVFIIKHAIEKDFREIVGKRIEPFMEVNMFFRSWISCQRVIRCQKEEKNHLEQVMLFYAVKTW